MSWLTFDLRSGNNRNVASLASQPGSSRLRLLAIYTLLGVLNLGAWVWAFLALFDKPLLLGVALTVYGLGLRHALDADHIAAIENVTRRLMGGATRPVSVGFYFALGHSSIVIFATALLAGSANVFGGFERFHFIGAWISTIVSATFLIFIAENQGDYIVCKNKE